VSEKELSHDPVHDTVPLGEQVAVTVQGQGGQEVVAPPVIVHDPT
jgi:hypothetical protein